MKKSRRSKRSAAADCSQARRDPGQLTIEDMVRFAHRMGCEFHVTLVPKSGGEARTAAGPVNDSAMGRE